MRTYNILCKYHKLCDNSNSTNLKKCFFSVKGIHYLGYIVEETRVFINPKEDIDQSKPTPTNILKPQNFLGMGKLLR